MNSNLITLIMGSTYLVGSQNTQGLRFDIGDANPSTIFCHINVKYSFLQNDKLKLAIIKLVFGIFKSSNFCFLN